MNLSDDEGLPIQLDILGQGELFEACVQASQQPRKTIKIRTLGTVSYGVELFQLMQNYHALVIPTISDEGHRVVYDAYSQALPVLASDTVGLREIVHPEETGQLIPPESSVALASTFKRAIQNFSELERMGVAALAVARSLTHKNMHQQRWYLLQELINSSKHHKN
jgi:glycosyltransferase involved in cell wall biosynthesis